MIHIPDFQPIQQRFEAYWAMENHDRPLATFTAPRYRYQEKLPPFSGTLRERWLDVAYQLKAVREQILATYYVGEAFSYAYPNLGPDVFGAYFGGNLAFGEETSWSVDHLTSLDKVDAAVLPPQNFWWQKTQEMTRAMLDDSRGDYMVGITDLHPGMDCLVSLRGPETVCFDLYEEPDLCKRLCLQLADRMGEVYHTLNNILETKQKGNTNWMGVYHPEGWYVISCDFICLISPDMYKEFVEPELAAQIKLFPHNIFHLDGPGALVHLDSLLSLEGIAGIQWVYGAGQPTAAHWIPVLQKIQNAGKLIHVDVTADDLPVLLEHLRPEGVLYNSRCRTPEEADAMYRMVTDSRPKTVF